MKVTEVPFAVIDFESAGSAPGLTDEPVQIAVIHWNGEEIKTALNSYLRPSRKVTWSAKEVHGIGDEMLVRAPLFVDLWPQVKSSLGNRWVVAHGAATEKRFLRVFPFHGFGPWVDTLTLTRAVYPSLPSHALSDCGGCRPTHPITAPPDSGHRDRPRARRDPYPTESDGVFCPSQGKIPTGVITKWTLKSWASEGTSGRNCSSKQTPTLTPSN